MKEKKQVNKKAYRFERYMRLPRWVSTHVQINEVLKKKPQTVLEIGKGFGVFEYVIKNSGINYTSIDIAEGLYACL